MEFRTGRTLRWIASVTALALLAVVGITLSRLAGKAETARADSGELEKPGVRFSLQGPPGLEETLAAQNAVAEDTPEGRLILAARRGDADRVREILGEGVAPDAEETKNGHRALHQAAHAGQLDVVDVLLAAGAAPDAPDRHGLTPLMRAAESAAVSVGRRLLDVGADVNAQYKPNRQTALTQLAAGSVYRRLDGGSRDASAGRREAELEFARMLFERGADPNLRTGEGSPLKALAVAQNAELLALFIEHGARGDGDPDLAMLGMMPGPIGEALRAALLEDPEPRRAAKPVAR